MRSVIQRPFYLKFQAKRIPKLLDLNAKINEIVLIAKPLFNFSVQDNIQLKVNDTILNEGEEITLKELGLQGKEELEIILMALPPQDSITINICLMNEDDADFHTWATYLSEKLAKVKHAFCESQGVDSNLYNISVDGNLIDEDIQLSEISEIQASVLTLEKKQQAILNSDQVDEHNKEDERVEEKELQFRISGDEMYELSVNWFAKIKSLKISVAQALCFAENTLQRWSIDKKHLDEDTYLNTQLDSEENIIDIERLAPIIFTMSSRDKVLKKIINIDPNRKISLLKQEIASEIQIDLKNQAWFSADAKESLEDNQKLLHYKNGDSDLMIHVKDISEINVKPKSAVKKIFTFDCQGTVIRKQVSVDEDIGVVAKAIQKSFKLSEDARIILMLGKEQMDPKKSLSDYMKNNTENILVVLEEDQANLIMITIIFEDAEQQVSLSKTQTIQDLKVQVCSLLKIHPPYLYSLFFDLQVLKSSQKLEEIDDLDESSVLKLRSEVEIKLFSQKDYQTYIFSVNYTVADIKAHLIKKKLALPNKFDLYFGQNFIDDDQRLKDYIQNDEEIKIFIKERAQIPSKDLSLDDSSVSESKEFSISVSENLKLGSANFLKDESEVDFALERNCRVNLILHNIKGDVENISSLNINQETPISTLKKAPIPALEAELLNQCWMKNDEELINDLRVKDYLDKDANTLDINIFVLQNFIFSIPPTSKMIPLSLNMTISSVREKIKSYCESVDLKNIQLEAYTKILER